MVRGRGTGVAIAEAMNEPVLTKSTPTLADLWLRRITTFVLLTAIVAVVGVFLTLGALLVHPLFFDGY
jgi:hypothetical protein